MILVRPEMRVNLDFADHLRLRRPKNRAELWEYAQQEWEKIPIEYCQNLAYSFPKRMKLVIAAKGHAIDY